MHHTILFRSNRSQAVRLGKDVAFPETVKEVTIIKEGARRIIVPTGAVWDDFFEKPGTDLPDRDQPPMLQRDPLEYRPALAPTDTHAGLVGQPRAKQHAHSIRRKPRSV